MPRPPPAGSLVKSLCVSVTSGLGEHLGSRWKYLDVILKIPAQIPNISENHPQFVLRGTSAEVHTLHFYCGGQEPDYPILFSGSSNGLIHVWNLKTRRVDTILDGHGGKSVHWVEAIYGRDRLLSQGRNQKICLWDLAEGRNTVTDSVLTENVGFCKCSLLKVAQGRWLMAMPGKDLDEVQVLELPSKTSVCTLKPEADAKPGMAMCLKLWQPDFGSCPFLLAGYEDGSVILWNLSGGKILSRLACHQEPVMSLDFDSEKTKGVSGSSEEVLTVWSLDEQQNLKDISISCLILCGGCRKYMPGSENTQTHQCWDC
ncbi:guanine nucleotide-binding protein subunit beta-like protein 1 isoform X4 [Caretta caretta]|uniref:guanine nucleotide-binding protein subunit beta-like protein 1 isoform X4 n=1 Tax=Caretta caretta TaxID=8467 RepID=UPI003F4B83DF